MKLILELDTNLLDEAQLGVLPFLADEVKTYVAREVRDQLVAAYIEKLPSFGELGITKKELKAAVLDKMAEKAVLESMGYDG